MCILLFRLYPVRQKNCTVLFLQYLYMYVSLFCQWTSLYWDNFRHTRYDKLSITCVFYIFHTLKTGNQLNFQQCSALAHCSHTVLKVLCREMMDVFVAPKLWLTNIADFNDVDYSICFTVALHFWFMSLHTIFHVLLNVWDNNTDVQAYVTTGVGCDTCTYADFHKALPKYPSREIDDVDIIFCQVYPGIDELTIMLLYEG